MHTPSPRQSSTDAAPPKRWPYLLRLLVGAALGMGVALFALDLAGPAPRHLATIATLALLGATLALSLSTLGALYLAERWCLSPLAEMGICVLGAVASVPLGGWAMVLASQHAPSLAQESSTLVWMGVWLGAGLGAAAAGLHAWRDGPGKG